MSRLYKRNGVWWTDVRYVDLGTGRRRRRREKASTDKAVARQLLAKREREYPHESERVEAGELAVRSIQTHATVHLLHRLEGSLASYTRQFGLICRYSEGDDRTHEEPAFLVHQG